MNDRYSHLPSRDWCNAAGAAALKATIEAYWRERGAVVCVKLHQAPHTNIMRSGRLDLRSDMIGGRPAPTHPAMRA